MYNLEKLMKQCEDMLELNDGYVCCVRYRRVQSRAKARQPGVTGQAVQHFAGCVFHSSAMILGESSFVDAEVAEFFLRAQFKQNIEIRVAFVSASCSGMTTLISKSTTSTPQRSGNRAGSRKATR